MRLVLAAAAAVVLTACTSSATQGSPSTGSPSDGSSATGSSVGGRSSAPTTTGRPPASTSGHRTPTAPPQQRSAAQQVFAGMSLQERVGQLLMVDCSTTGVSQDTTSAITRYHVGSVILDGTSHAGITATADVTNLLRRTAPGKVALFVATDQEGGQVQRLQGPGFVAIPSAVEQGSVPPATLATEAKVWGEQLSEAGVTLNLAPVLDTVPGGFGANPPIGDLDREYGNTTSAVTAHGLAFARGMAAGGIAVAVKHFPGLGRVRGNTDTTSGVTDTVTTRHDAYLAPFRAAVRNGVPFVMISTAIYSRIDPGTPAAFSRTVVTGMLRHDLAFRGIVISDDLGIGAQVRGDAVGQRAVRFVAAGGDMVLTVDASQAAAMTSALVGKARSDPRFRAQVDAAALLVLQEKQRRGLLH